MKKTLFVIGLVLLFANCGFAQEDKTVTVTVSGQGKTQDEAKQNALRNAIEQAFGTFISSNTTILNDELVKDEIVSVSSGNIQKYDVLNTATLPDSSAAVTLSATVSVSKLISFSEAKGVVTEFKGGLFTINVKQQILNEEAEVKAIWDMLFMLSPIAFQSFDYTIQTSDPKSLDAENKNWYIPITVLATTNKNIDFLFDYFQKNLASIALKNEEVANYNNLNKKVFPISFNGITYSLRKEESINAIKLFFKAFPAITRNFMVDNGLSKHTGNEIFENLRANYDFAYSEEILSPFKEDRFSDNKIVSIPSGSIAGTYNYKDFKNLTELEKLSGYRINPVFPLSKLGSWYNGGVIIFENNKGGGLIAAFNDLGTANWKLCKNRTPTSTAIGTGQSNTKAILKDCPGNFKDEYNYIAAYLADNAVFFGYDDWFLPSKDELNLIYLQKHFLQNYGRGYYTCYWSSSDCYNPMWGTYDYAWTQDFSQRGFFYNENDRLKQSSINGGTPCVLVPAIRAY